MQIFCVLSSILLAAVTMISCRPAGKNGVVVIYTSVDDVYAAQLVAQFEKETGIQTKLVTDSEETKSTGLLNRLLAEKNRPQADVFWSGDPMRCAVLKQHGITVPYQSAAAAGLPPEMNDPDGHFTGFCARSRVLLYNTNLLAGSERPVTIFAFTNVNFRGKTCLANPLFGSTSMHAAALFQSLGKAEAETFFNQLTANQSAMLSSNGEVKRRVAAGDFAVGLTDSDDAWLAVQEGKPVGVVFPDQEALGTLIIPNAVSLIKDGPNPENGKRFFDFLVSAKAEQLLVEMGAGQWSLRKGTEGKVVFGVTLEKLQTLRVDYAALAIEMERLAKGFLQDWVNQRIAEK